MTQFTEDRRKKKDRTRELSRSIGRRQGICSSSADQVPNGRGKPVNTGVSSLSGSTGENQIPTAGQSKGKRRLLEQKRGILLEIKDLVSRQTETIDRLAEGCGDTTRNRKTSRSVVYTGRAGRSLMSSSRGTSMVSSSVPSSSRRQSQLPQTRCSSTGRNAITPLPPLPSPPEQSATSKFLTLGGRWENTTVEERVCRHRSSIASSASYASYGERDNERMAKGGGEMPRYKECYRTPKRVPALRIGK